MLPLRTPGPALGLRRDLAAILLLCLLWLALDDPAATLEFDAPYVRALLLGFGCLLALPPLLSDPVAWDRFRGVFRVGAVIAGSFLSAFLQTVLSLQQHLQMVAEAGIPEAGQMVPGWETRMSLRLAAGLPWIAALFFSVRRGVVASPPPAAEAPPAPAPVLPDGLPAPPALPDNPGPDL